MTQVQGSCLCGAVRFACEDDFSEFHLCHCTQCQKTSGSAHVANLFTRPENIEWLAGASLVKRYDVPGRVISTAFCSICGSAVPYLSTSGDALIVPAGSLDTSSVTPATDHIFWAERAAWYEPGIDAPKFARFPK